MAALKVLYTPVSFCMCSMCNFVLDKQNGLKVIWQHLELVVRFQISSLTSRLNSLKDFFVLKLQYRNTNHHTETENFKII